MKKKNIIIIKKYNNMTFISRINKRILATY